MKSKVILITVLCVILAGTVCYGRLPHMVVDRMDTPALGSKDPQRVCNSCPRRPCNNDAQCARWSGNNPYCRCFGQNLAGDPRATCVVSGRH